MYVPRHFAFPEGAKGQLQDLIEAHNFGLLVAGDGAGAPPEAAHLPFVLDRARGPLGTLIAHVARANPLWRRFAPGREVLVVFQGPHAYVSPDWYAGRGLVPTWNYVAVHGYGVPRLLTDEAAAMAALAALSAVMEAGLAPKPPWTMDQLSEGARRALVRGIVAFEIELARLEGKQKLNQNRSAADRAGVIAALQALGGADAHAMASAMGQRERDSAAS
jgi:transcriptional regulator